ncbi:MAG: RraA family protein, partial [Proteobacteria bacterium]|nr:RraA family protein [Pseudomonadota bacterium]
ASQIEITCGSVKVNTGDFIVADEEGIVVIPQNDIKNVLDSALQKKTRAESQPLDEWRKNHYKKISDLVNAK